LSYLLENQPENRSALAHLLNLLNTEELKNWDLAFQLLQGGGMTDDDFLLNWAKIMFKIRKSPQGFYFCLKYNFLTMVQNRKNADLRQLEITDLPENLFQLSSLRKINLNQNKLKNLPDLFAQLPKLKSLSLDDNLLEELPDSLFELSQLNYLDISYNPIEKISPSIQKLKNLKSLWLIDTLISPEHFAEVQGWLPDTYVYDELPF
jgi:Leucine-rich repeat (LRR) protein